jgi:hypothetical protein
MKFDWRRDFPEHDMMGDPLIRELVTGDDLASDYRYNHEMLDLTAAEGETHARAIEALRDQFSIETLDRWWRLQERETT